MNITQAKQKRFSLTARILTGRDNIDVQLTDQPGRSPCWKDGHKPIIYINQAATPTTDSALELIYDRGKLFRQLGHVKWTREPNKREVARRDATDPHHYDVIADAMEAGRVERLIGMTWPGAVNNLKALWQADVDSAPGEDNGLQYFVRTGNWRCKEEEAHWKTVEPLLRKAWTAKNSRTVWDLAKQACSILYPPVQQPPQQQQSDEGEQQPQPQQQSGSQSQQDEQPKNEQEQQPQAGGSGSSEGELGDDGEQQQSGKQKEQNEDGGEEADGEQSQVAATQAVYEALKEAVQQEIAQALDAARGAAQSELHEMEEEITQPEEQQYADTDEAIAAEETAAALRSILVERSRVNWQSVRRGGTVNPRRIANVITGDAFLRQRLPSSGPMNVALLLDVSGSINGDQGGCGSGLMTSVGRVFNGALQKANITRHVWTFGYKELQSYANVPLESFSCNGGTPTGKAMEKANEWLATLPRGRNLLLILTDGEPDSVLCCVDAFKQACDAGTHVMVVGIGTDRPEYFLSADYETWCAVMEARDIRGSYSPITNSHRMLGGRWMHDACTVHDVGQLSNVLSDKLQSFALQG